MADLHPPYRPATAASMNDAFTVKSLRDEEGGESRYSIVVEQDFCFAGHVSGGFINAIAVNAAKQFIMANFPPNPQIHVISSYIQFFSNILAGSVNITCCLVSSTSQQIVIKVELTGATRHAAVSDKSHPEAASVLTILTFRTNHQNSELSQKISSPALLNLPNRERDCSEIDVLFMKQLPMTRKFHWWSPRSSPSHGQRVWGHYAGGNIRDVFIRTADSLPLGVYELTWIADLGLQPPFTLDDDLVLRWKAATMSITIEYKKPIPEHLEWVLVRTHSHVVSQGKYDMDCFIIDPRDNEVLLLARHVVFAKPINRTRSGTRQRPSL